MDQDFKPTEEAKPTDNSMPNEAYKTSESFQPTTTPQPFGVTQTTSVSSSNSPQSTDSMQSFDMEHPAEEVKTSVAVSMPKFKVSRKGMGKTVLIILVIVLVAGAGVAAYLWRDKTASDSDAKQATTIASLRKSITSLEAEVASLKGTSTPTCTTLAPGVSSIDSIKASITSGNTAALLGYMATNVNVVDATSGSVIAGTATQAVSSVTDFITGATKPWNFELTSAVLNTYKAGDYVKYFPSTAVVGQSANNKIISFNFDCTAKISAILLSPSQSLLQ